MAFDFIHWYFDILIDVSAVQSPRSSYTQSERLFTVLLWVLIDSGIYGGFGGRACVDPGSCVQWCMVKAADPRCPAGVPGKSWLECGLTLRDSHQPSIPEMGRRQRGSSVMAELDKAPNSPWLTVDYWCACRKMCFQNRSSGNRCRVSVFKRCSVSSVV